MIKLEDIGINKSASITHIANLAPSYSFEFESLSAVVKNIISSEHRIIPIVSKKQDLVGIISYMDILDTLLHGTSRNIKISEVMTRGVVSCETTESTGVVLQKIKISRRDGIPVVKNMKLVGMASEHDFVKLVFGNHFGISVREAMSHKPLFVTPNISILTCIKTMVNTHYHRLPVIANKEIIGMITGNEILRYLDETNYSPMLLHEKLEHIMTSPVIYTVEYDDVSDAVKLMVENKIGGLPVIDENNSLKGIITERDIIEML